MATVKITSDDSSGQFPKDSMVRLQAQVEGGTATAYAWERDGVPLNHAGSQYEFQMTTERKGSYRAIATVGNAEIRSDPFPVNLKADEPGQTPSPAPTPEPPPVLYKAFAAVAAVVTAAIGWLVLRDLFNHRAGFSDGDWVLLEARLKTGAMLSTPIMILGAVALLVGLWMAVVEWRGRFAKKEPTLEAKGLAEETPKIIEAIGKLKGAALAMVLGAVLMLAAAWIAQSTASPSPAPAPTPSVAAT